MNRRHVSLIARYSARYSVRGGVGLVFVLLSLTFGLLVAHSLIQPVEMVVRGVAEQSGRDAAPEVTKQALDRLVEQARPAVAWVLSSRSPGKSGRDADASEWADYLLVERPAMLSAIFLILLWGWPFIVTLGAFDLYAGDIASRQLRYHLLRADRRSIFFGRLLGAVVTFIAVLLLLGVTIALYLGIKLPLYGWGSLLGWTLYGMAALACVSLPYIALTAWISAAIGSSFAALSVVSLIVGGVPLLAMFGRWQHEAAGYLLYVLPWGFQTRLFHPSPAHVAAAAAGCLGLTALYGWLGYRKFTTRDL